MYAQMKWRLSTFRPIDVLLLAMVTTIFWRAWYISGRIPDWNAACNCSGGSYKKRLPQALVIGSKRGGTTPLMEFLAANHWIKTPLMELHFFDPDRFYEAGYDGYRSYMPYSEMDQITVEKTPQYFVSEAAAARIHAMNSSMKLILMLRDPVKRLLSDYAHEKELPDVRTFPDGTQEHYRRIEKDYSLEELVFSADGGLNMSYEPVVASMYDVHVQRFLALFPREQLLVLDGEYFLFQPVMVLRQCEEFLGVPHAIQISMFEYNISHGYHCLVGKKCHGDKFVYTSIDETIFELRDLYAPHVRNLVDILGQTFSWQSQFM